MRIRSEQPSPIDELRARLQKMTNRRLREFGQAAAYMCSKKVNPQEPPHVAFDIQLEEARQEWKRRQDRKKKRA